MYPGCHQIHIQITIHINRYFTRKDGVQAETVSVPQLVSEQMLTQLCQLMWTCLYPRTFASESRAFPSPFRGNLESESGIQSRIFPFEGNWSQCFIENANPTLYILIGLQRSPEKSMGFEVGTNWCVRTHPSFASHIILGKEYKPWVSFLVFKGDLMRHNL